MKNDFKNESNFYGDQEMLRCRENFRGILVKEWVTQSEEVMFLDYCNEVLVNTGTKLCLNRWRNICDVVYELEN